MDLKRALAGLMGSAQNLFVSPVEANPALRDEQHRRQAVHQNDNKKRKQAAPEQPAENPAVIVTLGQKPEPRLTYDHLKPRR